MKRRLLALLLAVLPPASAAAAEKMNVLYIVSDDLSTRLGTYGHAVVKSPNIDGLAARGVRFDRAYCQYPLCGPSRASFLTGLRPDRTTVIANLKPVREALPNVQTMPQTFQKGGYFVARVGKLFHYGVPRHIGTDGVDDAPSWHKKVNPIGRDKAEEPKVTTLVPGQYGAALSWMSADGTDEEQTDGIGATETIKLIEENKDKPFFIACGFYRPHTPYVAPHKWFAMYALEDCAAPTLAPNYRQGLPAAAFFTAKKEQDAMTDTQRRQAIQAYFAATSFMDAQVGRLVAAIERLGLSGRTIIIFHSDHGYHLGEHGLWQKLSLWENSARVPLIIFDPRARGNGKSSPRTVELVDLHATLADLCDLPAPKTDGQSLRPLLDDPNALRSRPAYTQAARGSLAQTRPAGQKGFMGRSVRTERYRYIEWDEGREGTQLYDYETDPNELTNLANEPTHAETVKQLTVLLHSEGK